ncbi:MAG: GDP-fucose synthetase [Myxococcaceae bacterium]|nr:GDP-fucose synthetase [Myxococcaceae bacterium]
MLDAAAHERTGAEPVENAETMDLKGKRIVVTGGAGFLGSHLVAQLGRLAPETIVVPRSSQYDLTQSSAVAQLYHDARPDLVFHLAARVGGIGANQRNPGRYFHDNMAMGLHILEQGRVFGIAKLVLAGTICAYPKFAPVPFQENDLWNGFPEETNAPYGVAKKALIVMAESYRAQYGQNAVVALPVNLYGPRDNFDLETSHVIPAMINKFLAAVDQGASDVQLWGDGSPTREFLYVDDCAEGFIRMAERYDRPEPVNLGSGREISIRELAELVGRLCGYRGNLVWQPDRPNGQPRRSLDVARAREALGFASKTTLEDGLQTTIDWYRQHRGDAE